MENPMPRIQDPLCLRRLRRVSLLAGLAAAASSCAAPLDSSDSIGEAESAVYIGDDGLAWADNQQHPQVVRILAGSGACTAWLSSSNTLTTNTHCVVGAALNSISIQAINSSQAQQSAFAALGQPVQVIQHPGGPDCWGGDLAVIVYDPAKRIPRSVLAPLPVMSAPDEPECDGDDACIMLVGAGGVGYCDGAETPSALGAVNQIYMESGLGDGHCSGFDSDMLYGEYDFDDSSPCPGDSGSPIFWAASGEVMAVHRGYGGDGGDDAVGPILWTNEHSARAFFFENAADRDKDGVQAAHDNCDVVANAKQEDWNKNGVGDACEDSDLDGLFDAKEFELGTDPAKSDTDADALDDGDEVKIGTNPRVVDTDSDGAGDGYEVLILGTDPLVPTPSPDCSMSPGGASPPSPFIALLAAVGALLRRGRRRRS